ncbi:acyl CoA:acetate/3-ketoacid CoA transferase [Vibrio sp. OCN044]|uniref:Acetate CoA-transferase YdiF n=1 Tax=Vibrio tetraodonis subsp. pristinus TaxID=2695891 RepID=A0A6L8LX79_9VIBR|nr:CoA-transferase [Vibrio tetraodonis]MYM59280.1 acyl CoA:acetate/3-ketoacid CoA transferase [Vibrio tetraodonis subsp. pristinus]
MKMRTAKFIAELINDGSVVIPGGFGCCGHPDVIIGAISDRFQRESQPTDLTLIFGSGGGDKKGQGLDKLADSRLIKRAIGGFWGFCPSLTKLGLEGKIEAHNWPMGVISHLFRDIATGLDGHLSHIGLNTFVDPRLDGGSLSKSQKSLVELTEVRGKERLFYPSLGVDFALLRGTLADHQGNVSMRGEAALHDAFWQAMAARNAGGKVVIQVERVIDKLVAEEVDIPGNLVDYIVISGEHHFPSYGSATVTEDEPRETLPLAKSLIIERACREFIPEGAFLNFGIGIPAIIGEKLSNLYKAVHTSIESGVINGSPKQGISFGEVNGYSSIIQQADLFSFYNGGGIDIAFLGFAEIDQYGNINASSFGEKVTGAGGFINIAASAKKLVFCGTMSTKGLILESDEKGINIKKEGEILKFVKKVQQITISTNHSEFIGKHISIITERAVFTISEGLIVLEELAKGVSAEDIIKLIPFPIKVSDKIKF